MIIDSDLMRRLIDEPDAWVLYGLLRTIHGGTKEPFVLANATGRRFGWGKNRLKAARDMLTELVVIECIHPGGRGEHDPPIYRWC